VHHLTRPIRKNKRTQTQIRISERALEHSLRFITVRNGPVTHPRTTYWASDANHLRPLSCSKATVREECRPSGLFEMFQTRSFVHIQRLHKASDTRLVRRKLCLHRRNLPGAVSSCTASRLPTISGISRSNSTCAVLSKHTSPRLAAVTCWYAEHAFSG
jgi:hypothetical protein